MNLTRRTLLAGFGRSHYADPYLDNVRLYSRALSAAEVSSFYTSGS